MKLILPLISLIAVLSGCATPSPDMMGAARHEISVGGMDFVVFHYGAEAEVVRMGYLTRRERDPVPQLMIRATEATTGCAVIPGSTTTKIPGDTGVARFDLDCGWGT